jgi:hypothetical protein
VNSLRLLQSACGQWLTEEEMTQLSARDAELLLVGVNAAMRVVWAALPATYRRQPLSLYFGPPEQTTGVFTQNSREFTGDLLTLKPDYCSLRIEGQADRNEYRMGALFHPYTGTTGTRDVTVFRDTILTPYQIDRISTPLRRLDGVEYSAVVDQDDWTRSRTYAIIMVGTRTLVKIDRENQDALTLTGHGIIRPYPLNLIDSQQATPLPFPPEVAEWIASASGEYLVTHPKFRPDLANAATRSVASVLAQIESSTSPALQAGLNSIGTPAGW